MLVSDAACLRFLIARKFDVNKALAMIKEAVEIRTRDNLDAILDAPNHEVIEKILAHYPACWHGFDRRGHPIYIEFMGRVDFAQIVADTSMEDFLKFHALCQEWTRRKVHALATARQLSMGVHRRVDSAVAIMDLKGLGRKQLKTVSYNFLTNIAKVDSICYPESLLETWIINTGLLFSVAYAVVRPFLDERTTSKFKIFRNTPTKEFSEILGAENLPPWYGGSYPAESTDEASVLANAPLMTRFRYLIKHGNQAYEERFGIKPEMLQPGFDWSAMLETERQLGVGGVEDEIKANLAAAAAALAAAETATESKEANVPEDVKEELLEAQQVALEVLQNLHADPSTLEAVQNELNSLAVAQESTE